MLLKNKLNKIKSVLNSDNVLTSIEERYCYAKDALNIERDFKIPDLIVFVETIEDIQKVSGLGGTIYSKIKDYITV